MMRDTEKHTRRYDAGKPRGQVRRAPAGRACLQLSRVVPGTMRHAISDRCAVVAGSRAAYGRRYARRGGPHLIPEHSHGVQRRSNLARYASTAP